MAWDFYGRKIYNSSFERWEELAKEYIPHFMYYRDCKRGDDIMNGMYIGMVEEEPARSRVGWCTYCGSCFSWDSSERSDIYTNAQEFFKAKHGERLECPCCFRPVTFISERKMTSYNSLTKVQRLIFSDEIDKNHVNFYAVRVRNYGDMDTVEQLIEFEPASVYELSPGSVKMYRYGYDQKQHKSCWIEQKSIQEPFKTYFGHGGDYNFVELGFEYEFGDTFLKYSQFEDFENVGMCEEKFYGDRYYYYMTYLCMYCLYPQIEFLMKNGSYVWIYDLVYNRDKNKKYIDWTAKNYMDMFRMNKLEVKAFATCGFSKSLLERYYHSDKSQSIIELCEIFKGYSFNFHSELLSLLDTYKISIDKLNRYFNKNFVQRDRFNSRCYDSTFQMWRDYIKSCEILGVDLDNEKMLFPSDLIGAHDERALQVDIMQNEELLKRAQRSLERRDKKYRFEDDRFIIYLPHLPSELVLESNMQDNCVAKNYTQKHFKDECTILFLREKAKINESLYTIEMVGNTVVQKHGYHNDNYSCDKEGKKAWAYYMSRPLKEANRFFDLFLSWVCKGSPRDSRGIPIIQEKKVGKRA